jgi:GNAT superfamily N-acetyltransferase
MPLEFANWVDLLPILRENSALWSVGLSEQLYRDYVWRQINHPWSRKHLRYLICREGGVVVSCCKVYQHVFSSRGEEIPILGISAVFVPARYRGKGFGRRMLLDLIELAREEKQAGLMLYSDIGSHFYGEAGFEPFWSIDFVISLEKLRLANVNPFKDRLPMVKILESVHDGQSNVRLDPGLPSQFLGEMVRHYRRWLRRQPFGLWRSEEYLAFKLGREEFLTINSSLEWPKKTFWVVDEFERDFAYAITEKGETRLRILEMIGSHKGVQALWQAILSFALDQKLERIGGWEAVVREYAPSFSVSQIFDDKNSFGLERDSLQVFYSERDWGLPTIYPLNGCLDSWWSYYPCPFLELDHF